MKNNVFSQKTETFFLVNFNNIYMCFKVRQIYCIFRKSEREEREETPPTPQKSIHFERFIKDKNTIIRNLKFNNPQAHNESQTEEE